MYVVGSAHPHKIDAGIVLERLVAAGERLVTDAEVFQEILHRYTAINRREAIGPAFQAMLDIVDEVMPIDKADVLRAGRSLSTAFRCRREMRYTSRLWSATTFNRS